LARVDPDIPTQPFGAYRSVGKSVPREDLEAIVSGSKRYVHDIELPGMLYGAVVRPPGYGRRLLKLDEEGFGKECSNVRLVRNGSFLGVIAKDTCGAFQAAACLERYAIFSELESFQGGGDRRDTTNSQVKNESCCKKRPCRG